MGQVPDDQPEVRSTLLVYLDDARQKVQPSIATATPEAGKAVSSDQKPDVAASIDVQVSLSAALHEQVAGSDTLFVYARALQGPPMPLALVRMNAAALPVRVTLDDTRAMIAEMNLSSVEQVEVVARISKSGQAKMQSGDFYGSRAARQDQRFQPSGRCDQRGGALNFNHLVMICANSVTLLVVAGGAFSISSTCLFPKSRDFI